MTADPAAYMPRAATERALGELERALLGGELPVVLTGPTGIGKTLLLRVAERRLAGRRRCVYIAYAALPAPELCAWILGLLGEPAPANGDTEAALVAVAGRLAAAGTPLVLLIDDASAVPPAAAERMRGLAASSRGALCIVAAGLEDADSEPWIGRFGARVERVALHAPMSAAETALYLRARLERAGASADDRGRFDAKVIERVFRRSGGIPRAVQALASEFLRVGEAALPGGALDALLAEEEAAELAARIAASLRDREATPRQRPERREAANPSFPVAATPPRVEPRREIEPPPPTPLLAASASRPIRAAAVPAPARAPAWAAPAKTAEDPPRVPVSPVAAVSPRAGGTPSTLGSSTVPPRPVPRTLIRSPRWQEIFLAVFGIGAVALAIPHLRSALTVLPVQEETRPRVPSETASELSEVAHAPAPTPEPTRSPSSAAQIPEPPVTTHAVSAPSSSSVAAAPPASASELGLAPIPVHINATPWATIEVDGVDMGETPIAGVPLIPGNHVFKARMPDGRIIERTVQVGPEMRHVTFE